jgi:hypothetical protein
VPVLNIQDNPPAAAAEARGIALASDHGGYIWVPRAPEIEYRDAD